MKNLLLIASLLLVISCKPKMTPNVETSIPMEINSPQLTNLITNNENIKILDVRTPGEVTQGKIPGAIEINYFGDDFASQIDHLNKDSHYIVYCKSGGRSAKSIAIMKEKGFTKCTNLEGGYEAWNESN